VNLGFKKSKKLKFEKKKGENSQFENCLSVVVVVELRMTTFRPRLVQKNFSFPFFFKFFEEQHHFHSFPKMAFSSSQNNFDLNVVPAAQQEIWRPSFLSEKSHLTTNDSVMLDDAIAASVVKGIITPRDEKLLANRSDVEAINDSIAFSMQGVTSVSNMARRLHIRGNEVQALRTQVLILQRLLIDFRRWNKDLQQENRELKKIVDSYANDLGKRYTELEKNTDRLREQHESLLLKVQRTLKISRPKA